MKDLDKELNFLPIFLILYLPIAVYGRIFLEKKEIFPISAWSLYSKTPSINTKATILAYELNGKELPAPINFNDYGKLPSKLGSKISTKLDKWLLSHLNHNNKLKKQLESEIKECLNYENITSFKIAIEKYYPYEKLIHNKNIKLESEFIN